MQGSHCTGMASTMSILQIDPLDSVWHDILSFWRLRTWNERPMGKSLEETLGCGNYPFKHQNSTIQISVQMWATTCSRQRYRTKADWRIYLQRESILSPDWASNVAVINAYDMRTWWILLHQQSMCHPSPGAWSINPSPKTPRRTMIPTTSNFPVVEKGTANREGEPAAGDQLVEGYTIQKVAAMTSIDACGYLKGERW